MVFDDLSAGIGQHNASSFADAVQDLGVRLQLAENVADSAEFAHAAILGGFGEELHFAVEAETVVLQERFKARAFEKGLRHGGERVAEGLDVAIFGVVEGAGALALRAAVA